VQKSKKMNIEVIKEAENESFNSKRTPIGEESKEELPAE
jgi:hypothetical protein